MFRYVLIQDNCSVHTAKAVKEWFQRHPEIEVLQNWPANSPDLNPMENLWAETTREWDNIFPRTRENLDKSVVENWERMRGDTQYFQNLYSSMPRRLWEVIANLGGTTKY